MYTDCSRGSFQHRARSTLNEQESRALVQQLLRQKSWHFKPLRLGTHIQMGTIIGTTPTHNNKKKKDLKHLHADLLLLPPFCPKKKDNAERLHDFTILLLRHNPKPNYL